jgi:hypothetical protein
VIAWGDDSLNQTDVPGGLANAAAIAAGWNHSLALTSHGTVTAWGWNAYGQTNVPPGLTNVVTVAGGRGHSLALEADGVLAAWGDDAYGQTDIPPGLPNVVGIMGGGYDNLVLLDTGTGPMLSRTAYRDQSLSVTFWTFLRKNYSLESKASLAQTNWTTVAALAGDGTIKTLTDPNANGSQGFYRVREK